LARNSTVPVGAPVPLVDCTVAVRVTDSNAAGFEFDAVTVVGPDAAAPA